MKDLHVVTSFSKRGYEVYGRRFLDSFRRHWPAGVTLHAFSEDLEHENVHDLRQDREHQEFCGKWADPEWNHPTDPNRQTIRFCHKVFAVTSDKLPKYGTRLWVDADVEWTAKVTEDWWNRVLPDDKLLAYLGRQGLFRPGQPAYTECGFVAYRVDNAKVRCLLDYMRQQYTTGSLFHLGKYDWHDSAVFDHCREMLKFKPEHCHNLSAGLVGTNVWPGTILAEVATHQKGPMRKLKVYGSTA